MLEERKQTNIAFIANITILGLTLLVYRQQILHIMHGEGISTPHIFCTQWEPFNQLYKYECERNFT